MSIQTPRRFPRRPEDHPYGTLILTWDTRGIADSLTIDRADPDAWMAGEWLRPEWSRGRITVDGEPAVGGIVKIRALNRTVIYRLVERLPAQDLWGVRWPD